MKYKGLSLRIRGAKTDLEEAGLETDNMAISTAKLREEVLALTKNKVDIMIDDTQFKSTYQIMEEISRVWQDIADVDQAALLELLGGKRQANILTAMLTNFDTAQQALEKSLNSTGSAVAENEKYLDSVTGKLNQLKAAWESLSATILDSDFLKGVLDLAINIVQALDKIVEAVGPAGAAISTLMIGSDMKSAFKEFFSILASGASKSSAATVLLKSALLSVGSAAAIIVAIKLAKWIWDVADTSHNAKERIRELSDEIDSMQSNQNSFDELAKRFEQLGNQTKLSAEETEEYIDVQNRLHELLPELKGYYDEHGNYIITEANNVQGLTEAWAEYLRQKKESLADEYVRDPIFGNSAYDNTLHERASKQRTIGQLNRYNELENKGSMMNINERGEFTELQAIYGTDVEAVNKLLRDTHQELNQIDLSLRTNALTAVTAQEAWYKLSEDEKSAIENWIGELDVTSVKAIIDAYADGSDNLVESILQDALAAVKQIKEETGVADYKIPVDDTVSGDIDITPYKELDDAIEELGKAYAEFAEDSKIGLDTLDTLQETFGNCGDAWNDFINTVSDGDSTLGDIKSSAEALAEAYLDEKVSLGEVNKQTKTHIQSMLESIGVTNANAVVEHQLAVETAEAALAKFNAAENTATLNEVIAEECALTGAEIEYVTKLAEALDVTDDVKLAAAQPDFRDMTAEEVAGLIAEARAAGMAAEAIAQLSAVERNKRIVDDAYKTGLFTPEVEAAENALANYYSKVEDYRQQIMEPLDVNINLNGTDAWGDYIDKASKATDKVSEEFEKMYDQLQALRDANLISEEEYLQKLFELNERYNKNNAATYRKYAMEIFNGMKSMMSDKVTASYDAEIASLEAQKKSTERYYDSLIDAEQDKLDLLRKEWETQEHLLKIEEARAALARAQQQKNVRVYREGQGFVWEADQQEVQGATSELNNALQEYDRYQQETAIEEKIDKLEELKERALEAIEEQIEAAQKAKEEALKYIEELQFSTEAFLEFFKMFGIEIDDETLKMIESFDLMAQQAGLSLEEIGKDADGMAKKISDFFKGDFSGLGTGDDVATTTTGGTTSAGSEGYYGGHNVSGDGAGDADYAKYGIFADFVDSMDKLLKDMEGYLIQMSELWSNTLDDMEERSLVFQANAIDRTKDKFKLFVTELTEQLTLLLSTFETFSSDANEKLTPFMDDMTKMFVGELENPFGGEEETLTWVQYFVKAMDEIIKKFREWWFENLAVYVDYVVKFHEWVEQAILDEIKWVNDFKDVCVEALDKIKEGLEGVKTALDEVKTSADLAADAVANLANAIAGLTGKTITIDVVYRYSAVNDLPKGVEGTKVDSSYIYDRTNPDGSMESGRGYAEGTLSLPYSGWTLTDEEGPEIKIPGKGTFSRMKYGTSIIPADVSRNLWMIGAKPLAFAQGIASMISNKSDDNRQNVFQFGDIHLPQVTNAAGFANEFRDIVMKATQLVYSK